MPGLELNQFYLEIPVLLKKLVAETLILYKHLIFKQRDSLYAVANEPRHEKTNVLHMQKQRRRSDLQ